MKALLRDLGTMEYEACWKLQQLLFDALLSGKHAGDRKGGVVACPGGNPPPDAVCPAEQSCPSEPQKKDGVPQKNAGETIRAEKALRTEETSRSGETSRSEKTSRTEKTWRTGEALRTEGDCGAEWLRRAAEEDPQLAGEVLLVEHPPVYTLGKSGHVENLLVSREALEAAGARFFHIDRGGDITFHGPGQLVVYPILDLERLGIGLRDYINALEEAVIRTVARYGITAGRIHGASGVWIDPDSRRPRKICAIGVRSSRYVTMHGFALNVTTDLGWFSRINPCGFTDRGVASIASETGKTPDMEEVKKQVVNFLSEELNVEIYK